MNKPFENPEEILTDSDYEVLTSMFNKRAGRAGSKIYTLEEIKAGVQNYKFREECRYYLTIKKLEMEMVNEMANNNTALNLGHWQANLKKAVFAIEDPYLRALNH